ncbi:MAG: hypothetical protein M1814_002456 [Vezdaea aestivalis]|nr:MAG: hypothetical protein M1814_002456 [Vezdaea aestivalis]
MSGLSYGLNLTRKKPTIPSRPPPGKRKGLFDDSDSETENSPNTGTEFITVLDPSFPKSSAPSKPSKPAPSKKASNSYGSLSTNHTTSKHDAEASALDPSIYDYDAFHTAASRGKPAKKDADQGPKYMSKLFAAAEVRKRDSLRAKEKMLAREREAEGEEYADKESFVTGAYKEQQEEVRRAEEEEERKEEETRKRGGKGLGGFYKGVLEKEEKRFEEVVKASEEGVGKGVDEEESTNVDAKIAEEAKRRGANVVVNDDGQVTDKRELLSAGLNIAPKPKATAISASASASSKTKATNQSNGPPGRYDARRAQRERQSRMMEDQLEQMGKRAADEESDRQREVERAAKSQKTEGEIMGAKERYLARKREAEEAKRKKAEG